MIIRSYATVESVISNVHSLSELNDVFACTKSWWNKQRLVNKLLKYAI